VAAPQIPQLDHQNQNILDMLWAQWEAKLPRNLLRTVYYDAKQPLKDLGISIPPQLTRIETALGWPAKGVNTLSRRCNFDGYVIPGDEADPYDLGTVLVENNMDVEIPQGITSALIHATAFITTTRGDVQSGEPDVLQTIRAATYATGIWNSRKRGLSAYLAITGTDKDGNIDGFLMYLPEAVYTIVKETPSSQWRVFVQKNPLGRVAVQPLPYQPELTRPFGHSRISRTVMSLTDQAIRSMLRTEVSAEFYSSPQRYLLGADESAFQDANGVAASKWQAVLGRFLAIGVEEDEDASKMQIGQFPQLTMEPHLAHLRQIAQNFASDQNLPISSLGIVQDNPASAEAIYAAKEELVVEAEGANRVFGSSLVRSGWDAVMLRDGLTEVPAELKKLRSKFRDPATPSKSSASDAMVKQIGVLPWMADSDVALEQLGYDETDIDRLRVDRDKAKVTSLLTTVRSSAATATTDPQVAELAAARGVAV
jgi:hypothetical protein